MKKISVKPLLICYLVIIIGMAACMLAFGDTYYLYFERVDTANDTAYAEVEPEGIVEVVDVEMMDNMVKATFRSLKQGTCHASLTYVLNKDNPMEYMSIIGSELMVMSHGIILSDSYDFGGNQWILIGIVLLFLVTMIHFFRCFILKLKHDFFSYRTILDMALSLYFLILTVIFAAAAAINYLRPGTFGLGAFFDYAGNGMSFVAVLSIPFVLIFAVFMAISNIWLIKNEGFRTVNLLGIFIGGFMILASGACFYLLYLAPFLLQTDARSIAVFFTKIALASAFVYFECLLFSTAACLSKAGTYKPKLNKDFIIILGCAIKPDGTLYPLLKGRVDKAIEHYKKQLYATGKKAIFVPSGGQGSDEVISEGEAMKRYLMEQGIPEEQIMPETESTTTLENMKYSKKLIDQVNPEGRVAFSTTNYHVFRGGMFAREAGMNAAGMGAKTKWYFWPNAEVREFIGLIVNEFWVHVAVVLGLAGLSVLTANMINLVKLIL